KTGPVLMIVTLSSPDDRRDPIYLSNYATIHIKHELARVAGVGDVATIGLRDYSMRVWLDPEKLAARKLTAADVLKALKQQNVQVGAGRIGKPPVTDGKGFQYSLNTLSSTVEWGNIILQYIAKH